MSLTFACGHCGKSFTVADEFAGKKGKCKQCGALMLIPGKATTRAELIPNQASPAPRSPSSRSEQAVQAAYGLDDLVRPARRDLPEGVEEVVNNLPPPLRLKPAANDRFAPPRKKKKNGSSDGGSFKLIVRVVVAVVLGLFGLGGLGAVLRSAGVSLVPGLASRAEIEAILQERVALNEQLAARLAGVNDVAGAEAASPEAIRKIKAIAANLRKLKGTKGLKTDLEVIKGKYLAAQEQASQKVIQEIFRIAAIPEAMDALKIQEAIAELDIEEKSLPGMSQVPIPSMPTPTPAAAPTPDEPVPEAQPGPPPGVRSSSPRGLPRPPTPRTGPRGRRGMPPGGPGAPG